MPFWTAARTAPLLCLLVAPGAACTRRHAPAPVAPSGPLASAARAVLAAGCAAPVALPPVPRAATTPAGAFDVVVYTAHPDDEAMYAGGTIRRLTDAGRRVALVPMTHGEGGRLLEPGPDGGLLERRDYPRARVLTVREAEVARAAALERVELAFVNPASADADYGFTASCEDALAHWERALPGGLAGVLSAMVADLRARRPSVVLTLDPRDDPQASHHGHHKAVGVLAELAARLAADPAVRVGDAPHAVREVLSFAPLGAPHDVAVTVDPAVRRALLGAYGSQFRPADLESEVARRPVEAFVLRWRARGVAVPPGGSVLADLIAAPAP